MPPLEYHTRARLKVGVAALRNEDIKVSEAARLAGYRSVKNFNAAIKGRTGLTPTQVRRLSGGDLERLAAEKLTLSRETYRPDASAVTTGSSTKLACAES
jgi:AraC-like DNA-binding protein